MSRFVRSLTLAAAASMAAVLVGTTLAEAQTRRAEPRPLVVKKRPFTDSGNVVPIGSESRYVYDSMQPRRIDPTYYSTRNWYGKETLPGPFGAWGN